MNKKGFVLSLDLVLGLMVLFLLVIASLFFVSRGSEITLSEHQLLRLGSDIVTVMEQEKKFDALNHEEMETRLESLLPAQGGMLVRIQGNFTTGNGTIEVGAEIPEKRNILTGKRVALTENNTLLAITYFVWASGGEIS